MLFNASAATGDRSPSLDLPTLQISLTRCPSSEASNIPSAAPVLCIYPGFGEVPIATGCRPHLGIYIAEMICTILATFKWLRPRERVFQNKVLLLHGWLWLPFTLPTQQFLSLRYWVDIFHYLILGKLWLFPGREPFSPPRQYCHLFTATAPHSTPSPSWKQKVISWGLNFGFCQWQFHILWLWSSKSFKQVVDGSS